MAPEQVASLLLSIKAVTLSPLKPYVWTSGIKAPIYCDNRLLMSYPEKWEAIIQSMADVIQQKKLSFDIIAGVATGSISHASLVAAKLKKPMIYVRPKAKEHSKGNQVEGVLKPGQKVLVVEDLISTGGSALNAIQAIRDKGGVVTDCIAIFTYEMKESREGFSKAGVTLTTLSNFSALLNAAEEKKCITPKEKQACLEWSKDPKKWPK